MRSKRIPKPSFLDACIYLGVKNAEKRWRSTDGKRIYTWDGLHGEIEAYNQRGKHIAVLDPLTGQVIKPAVAGRTIDV